ncbi:MAG: hypothetical protein H6556_32200 [Lewinellaceae bacterium]|nr:hypothetical protein [Lewinellaceae bacterium]
MPSERYDIETIERYLTHQMEGSERAEFEARLQADEGYRQELEAYRPILEGMQSLRNQNFRRQVNAWEEEWQQPGAADTELIEWYLNGELTDGARKSVEKRMEKDEAFAREVAAYRQVHEGFDAARAEAFRHKMVGWEKDKGQETTLRPAHRRPLWPRLAAAAAILFLLGLSFNWYLQANFSAGAIVETYYQPPLDEGIMGDKPASAETTSQSYQAAHRLFRQQQYPAAYEAFNNLLGQLPTASIDELSRTYYREHSEWNRLLAALATSPPPIDLKSEAQRIAAIDGHEFQPQAKILLRTLQSPFYNWAN